MTWFINMGEDIQRNQEIRFSFYRSIDEHYSSNNLIFTDTLHECGDQYVPAPQPWFPCSPAGPAHISSHAQARTETSY